MHRKDLAYINPELLKWAIDRSGLDRFDIAEAIKVQTEQITAWEQGQSLPQFNKALELAKFLHVPFGYLYLSQPPQIEIPIPDLRTLKDVRLRRPSVNFIEVLYQATSLQEWYKAYLQEQEHRPPLPFIGKYTFNDKPELIAKSIRESLGITDALRKEAGSWANYLTKLSQNAESIGIIVLRRGVVGSSNNRKLSRHEFQGFAIYDPIAPLVFINGQDFETAKIFTLVHEIAHIWIGKSGISNIDEDPTEVPTFDVEKFCNSIAVEVLVPREEFSVLWNGPSFSTLQSLARHFRVSTLVILRRASELNLLTSESFYELLNQAKHPIPVNPKESKGGSFYQTLEARNSPRLVDALIKDVRREGTLYRDAATLLKVTVPTIEKMAEGRKTV